MSRSRHPTRSIGACLAGFVLVIAAVAIIIVVPPASAQSEQPAQQESGKSWAVDPSTPKGVPPRANFTYTLKPGQVFQDSVTVSNTGTAPLTFDVYPADAYNTDLDAGFALRLKTDPKTDAAAWVTAATDRVTVEPGMQAQIPFNVAIPLDARPGDHAAGVVAESIDLTPLPDAQLGVQVKSRIAARLYVRVAGPLTPQLQIQEIRLTHSAPWFWPFEKGSARVVARVKNVGNTRVDAVSQVRFTGAFGRTLRAVPPQKTPDLLPGSSVLVSGRIGALPPFEKVTATVTSKGFGASASASSSFWALSVMAIAVLVAGILTIITWLWRRRRRPGADEQGGQEAAPSAPDAERASVGA